MEAESELDDVRNQKSAGEMDTDSELGRKYTDHLWVQSTLPGPLANLFFLCPLYMGCLPFTKSSQKKKGGK